MIGIVILLISAAALVLYTWYEKRLSQRRCLDCSARISVDELDEKCSSCRSFI